MTRPLRRDRTGAGAIAGATAARPPRRAPFVALVAFVLLGTLSCLLALNTLSAADELEQQSIADTNAVTDARAQQLQVDLAARRAPAALARAATALGMVPANQPAFLRIGLDGSVTVLGVPAPVTPPPIALVPPAAGSTALVPQLPAAAATTPPATTPPSTTPPSTTVTLPGGPR